MSHPANAITRELDATHALRRKFPALGQTAFARAILLRQYRRFHPPDMNEQSKQQTDRLVDQAKGASTFYSIYSRVRRFDAKLATEAVAA
ncbi:MAG: hypothetical protein AAGG38_02085 [Planctomycetota bacterium]